MKIAVITDMSGHYADFDGHGGTRTVQMATTEAGRWCHSLDIFVRNRIKKYKLGAVFACQ
jgi:hypothetical protein